MSSQIYQCCATGRTLLRCERCARVLDMAEVAGVGEQGALCSECLPIVQAEVERILARRAVALVTDAGAR